MSLPRRILIVAFHFPPIQGGSGVHRMLSYSRFLAEFGWEVKVLTVTPGAYTLTNESNSESIPEDVEVIRASAIDTARHLSFRSRYFGLLALPDRWQSWVLTGTFKGSQVIRKWRPSVILSTSPIASAHAIALGLNRLFDIPWIADFRDPMAMPDYPADPAVRKCYWWIEKQVFERANHITVTTSGTLKIYRDRYGYDLAKKISVIENGFDENLFPEKPNPVKSSARKDGPLIILHSGLVYSVERNPTHFFYALAEMRDEGRIDEDSVCFVFRASGYSAEYNKKFKHLKLDGLVRFENVSIPYKDAIEEMLSADALLLFQGAVCNIQIPAKLYEYLGAGRPVVALTDTFGDTAALLKSMNIEDVIQIDNKEAIKKSLLVFIDGLIKDEIHMPCRQDVMKLSRRSRTKKLNVLLGELLKE